MTVATIEQHELELASAFNPAVASLVGWAQSARAAHEIALSLVKTSFVPESFRDKPHEATAAILAGAEVGLSPMGALRSFDVIQGVAAPRANTLRAIVQSQGHDIWVESESTTQAKVCGKRRGSDTVQSSTWTIERASGLRLTGKDNWQKQPQAMLVARATAECCRRVAADAILGLPYSYEELDDASGDEAPAPKKRTAKRAAPSTPEPSLEEPAFASPEEAAAEAATDQGDENQDPPEPSLDSDAATPAQLSKLAIQFDEAGYTDRDDKLRYLTNAFGRTIASSKDLSKAEASVVIDAFEAGTILEVGEGAAS